MTWTLVANGQTNIITLHTTRLGAGALRGRRLEKYAAVDQVPAGWPDDSGGAFRLDLHRHGYGANSPLTLTAWVTDEPPKLNVANALLALPAPAAAGPPRVPPVTVAWSVFRGPGPVTFDNARPPVSDEGGKTMATATFGVPGDYILRLKANDQSGDGGGGFQCCWTNAHVAVSVIVRREGLWRSVRL